MNFIQIIINFGYFAIALVIFLESGVPFGFIFPGDSLLLTVGILSQRQIFNPYFLFLICCLAAIGGNLIGYFIGKKWGRGLFEKKNNFFFNPRNLKKAEDFYQKYGQSAILIARFIPVIRTFTPIFAGISKMNYKKFLGFTFLGAILWTTIFIAGGYFLGNILPQNEKYLLIIVCTVILLFFSPVILLPVIIKLFKKPS